MAATQSEVTGAANAWKTARDKAAELGKKPAGTVSGSDLSEAQKNAARLQKIASDKYDSYKAGFDAKDAMNAKSRSYFGL